jgi:hypothetical protein
MNTSDGIKSWGLFFLWEEGKTPLQFVGVSSPI